MLYVSRGVVNSSMHLVASDNAEWAYLMNYTPVKIETSDYETNERYKLQQAPYFIAGELKDNKRNNDNLLNKKLVSLDFEDLDMTLEEFKKKIHQTLHNVAYILYPTIHCFNKGKNKSFRYRLVMNTDRAYTESENLPLVRAVGKRIGVPFDEASGTYAQLMGLPILTPFTHEEMIIKNKGLPLPVTALIKHAPVPQKKKKTKSKYTASYRFKNHLGHTLERIAKGAQEGERNVWLTSIAGTLIHSQMDARACYEWLNVINDNFIKPPLDDEEVNAVFASVLKAEMKKNERS